MEERDSEAPKLLAWEVRLAALLPLTAAAMGALISAVLIGVFLALDVLLGEPLWVAEEGGGRQVGQDRCERQTRSRDDLQDREAR